MNIDSVEGYAADTPLKRNTQPENIVVPVQFFLSITASFVTSTGLLVDGGYMSW